MGEYGGGGGGGGEYQRMILYEIDLNLHISSKNDSDLIMSLHYGINTNTISSHHSLLQWGEKWHRNSDSFSTLLDHIIPFYNEEKHDTGNSHSLSTLFALQSQMSTVNMKHILTLKMRATILPNYEQNVAENVSTSRRRKQHRNPWNLKVTHTKDANSPKNKTMCKYFHLHLRVTECDMHLYNCPIS